MTESFYFWRNQVIDCETNAVIDCECWTSVLHSDIGIEVGDTFKFIETIATDDGSVALT